MTDVAVLRLPGMPPVQLTASVVAHLEAALAAHRVRHQQTRELVEEIAAFLRDRPPGTTLEVARGVRARDADVRRLLNSDARFRRAWRCRGAGTRAHVWELVPDVGELVPTRRTTTGETGAKDA